MILYYGVIIEVNVREQITECCKRLRLSQNIINSLDSISEEDNEVFLLRLFEKELIYRDEVRKNRNIKAAGFYTIKTFEGYDYDEITFPSELTPESMQSCNFIEEKRNLILFGRIGAGKTHMAIALGVEACKQGKKVLFFRTSNLVNQLLEAKSGGMLSKFLKKIEKADLIICDEWGYVPVDINGSRLLFQLISNCYENKSIIITTNLEFSKWVTIFYDEQMTNAMIDRLVHHSHLIMFHRDSWRMKESLIRQ